MINTLILRPSGTIFGYCINQYDGCSHGCRYCYGMGIRRKTYEDWIKPRPRKDVIEKLKKDIQKLGSSKEDIKDIFLGSITDSYQPLERTHKLTRQVIELLIQSELPFTILTKSDLVLRDIDLLKGYRWCRVGVTITSLDERYRNDLEPYSSNYAKRIDVLTKLKAEGISTYLSCEPIFPVKESDPISIISKLRDVVDLFEFGKWNKHRTQGIPEYYYRDYNDAYYGEVFQAIIRFCENEGINYCLASHSKQFIEKVGLPFKIYPLVKNEE